jgi:Tfp pilus assembly protein PilF
MFDTVFTLVANLVGGGGDDSRRTDTDHYRVDADPASVEERLHLARELATAGEPWRAAHHFSEALERAPDNAQAHGAYASLLAEQGYLDSAERHYRRALALAEDPDWRSEYEALLDRKGSTGQAPSGGTDLTA